MKNKLITARDNSKGKFQLDIEHYKQKSNWDCGISCVIMCLKKADREFFLDNFEVICSQENFNKSTWTIDLCYLLKKFNVAHAFYTKTMGVHPLYKGHTFYSSVVQKDQNRVLEKFENAQKNGIFVLNSNVKCNYILKHLKRGPIIVLVNAKMLSCDICKYNKISCDFRKVLGFSSSYQGHYIVLCGYNIPNFKIYYRNPSLSDRVCCTSFESFENCRKSFGTDQDIIFTFL